MVRIGVVGASGFAGAEFARLVAHHPELELVWQCAESQAGVAVADLYPGLAVAYPSEVYAKFEPSLLGSVDTVVLGLPHGASQGLMTAIDGTVERVIDLAADFRHDRPEIYDEWYGEPHAAPDLLTSFVYGLPERYRDEIAATTRVAAPGCYPTSAILPLAPLVDAGVIDPSHVIVDAACGVSGAGRPPKDSTTFCAVDENFTAYGVLTHRHTPEMEAHTGATVLFTPHLLPTNRGILSTIYGRVTGEWTSSSALDVLRDAYAGEPFVSASERLPSTKAALGSNVAHVSVRVDHRTGTVVAFGAIDNLVKGTAGQAIQCLNLMCGIEETTGLPFTGVTP